MEILDEIYQAVPPGTTPGAWWLGKFLFLTTTASLWVIVGMRIERQRSKK
jgi:hypothetical protein